MSFLAAHWLWLLVGVAAAAAAYVVLQRRRPQYAVRFTNLDLLDSVAPERPGWRRHVPAALFLLAAALLVVALARPTREEAAPRGPTVVLALDTSLSMEATDVEPSRLEAAQAAAAGLVDSLPENVNLGLVTFNGTAAIAVAPTRDHDAVVDAIESVELGEATAIGEAIFAGLEAIALVGERPDLRDEDAVDRIVLMSDGETTVGRADELATAEASDAGVPVSTIAFGTDGGLIEIPGEPGPVPVPVNEQALASIAEATDGDFFTAETADELVDAFSDVSESVDAETVRREISSWFLGLAVLLLAVTAVFSLRWFSRLP